MSHMLVTPMVETTRKPNGEPRWCFRCRSVQPFEFVVLTPEVSSWCELDDEREPGEDGRVYWGTGAYYSPTRKIECATCHLEDGDCFPGTWREWE